MPINVIVRSKQQVIVPIRFARAISGSAAADAPEVDDRGFAMGRRPPTWGDAVTAGAMVGITVGDTVRIRILADDLDADGATTPIFVTSTDPSVVAVISPSSGGPLLGDRLFEIRGLRDTVRKPVAIEARLGAPDGPVLGELEPHVFTLRSLRVRAHFVDIGGTPSTRNEADVAALLAEANAIWRPAGIEFSFDPANPRQSQREAVSLSRPGQVTVFEETDPLRFREASKLFRTRPDRFSINVYFVRSIAFIDKKGGENRSTAGLTSGNEVASGHGVILTDADGGGDAVTLAHELGHYLDLSDHADRRNDKDNTVFRTDMWTIRRLMFSSRPPASPPHRHDVGYGPGVRGALLTLKDLGADPNDGEVARARRRALNPF